MNDMEANLRQILDVRRGSVELSSTEAPQKLNSCLLKLRQLVKKNSVHTISNQTLQQTADLHMSKQTMEGTLWETCSPTASYLNDSAHLVAKKPRNTTTNKLNMTVNPKAGSQNSFAFYQPNIEDMKGRTPSTRPSSTKVANLMSSMSSPKATYLDLNVTDLNGSRSTKNAAFNPHKFINFLLSQPKTSTNQVKKASKLNSCVQGEEENDDNKNISGETRTKSFATSTYQLKKSVDAKNTSQPEGQINQENKVPVIQEYNLEKLRVSKSKVKIGLPLSDLKKNERSLTLTKKSSSGNLRKKKGLTVENDSMNEVEKNRRDTTADKSRSKKRLAVTPDTLSHRERDAEGEIQIDNKALRLTPKLLKACNDLLASRKDSAQKDARLKSRKRSSTRSKGQRLKSASKRNLKQESPVKNTVERAGNGRRQNAPGSLMLRAVKGSTPNILSSSISRIGGLSTKYLKKGESHTYLSNITGEFEKSNEMTMSHAHDTTANTKMGSRKDLTIDENNRDSVLLKRLLRAKSQGGKAIEEALAEMANRDKEAQQLGARSNGRVLSLKQSMKDKRTLAAFKSVDEKSSIFKDSDVNKSACNKTLNLEQKFESVMDHNSQEKSKECEQMGLLRKVLERTKQMLGDYKEKERVWQSEKQDLLKQIINLQKTK